MEIENQDVRCSIFWDAASVVKRTDAKIKEARIIRERQYYAQDILLEARALLMCPNYNAENPQCLSCHSISRRILQEYEHLAKTRRQRGVINKWLVKNRPVHIAKSRRRF